MRSIALISIAMFGLTTAASAANTCLSPRMQGAEREVNRMVSILVTNAPIECKLLPANGKAAPCSFLCVSTYTMSEVQHRSVQVYLAGAAGKEFNRLGVGQFDSLTFIDRTLALQGHGLRISAPDAARLQRQAQANQIDATQLVVGIIGAFRKVSTGK